MSAELSGARLVLAGGAGCAAALWLGLLISRAPLADLAAARAQDRLYAQALAHGAVAAPALAPPGAAITAPDRAAASQRLAELLERRALGSGLLVEARQRIGKDPGAPAELALTVSGPEPALLRFIAEVEGGTPLVRFRSWRIERSGAGGALRLTGSAIAVWEPAR